MKIAINTRFLLKNKLEGIGWFSYEVIKRMVEQHPEDEFLFIFDRPFDESFIFSDNIRPIVIPPPARHPILWYLWFEWAVPMVLKRYRADVFFSPDGYLSLSSKVPTVMVTHDIAHKHFPELVPGLVGRYYDYYVPKYLEKAERVITVSEFGKNDIHQAYGIPLEKMSVACNGSRAIFQPLTQASRIVVKEQFSQGKDYFFYVGAIHPRKNVHRLIEAFDQFKSHTGSDLKLLLAGRFAWKTGAVKDAYDQALHKEDIQFLGYISEEELTQLMGAAFALTYVSNFEGFGIPLLEAMHCDVPVITANVSSMPEVVGEAGLTVNPSDIMAICQAMKTLFQDDNLRQSLVAKAQEQRNKFTWERAAITCYDAISDVSRVARS